MERVEAVVIGAGVVGLACARALARAGREVLVLEAAAAFGTGVSSRNSEVLHAGIYYPPGSLKARLCGLGNRATWTYCRAAGVAVARPGKLVVAASEGEVPALNAIAARAAACGVTLGRLDGAEVRAREPEVRAVAGLWSPDTGILDSHGLMTALLGEVEAAGGMLARGAPVTGGAAAEGGLTLEVGGAAPMRLQARLVVNAAGLGAGAVGRAIRGARPGWVPPDHLAKGCYFGWAGPSPFRHLVYPVPEPGGLGVHATLDLMGRVRFGPDVAWLTTPDYRVDPGRAAAFTAAIRAWWPGVEAARLVPDYAGIRPKIVGPGAEAADFAVLGPESHGLPGLVSLHGIESPGLTAALPLGEMVAARLLDPYGNSGCG